MKFLKTIALGAITFAISLISACAPAPIFQDQSGLGYIRVGANFLLCGEITIKPKSYPANVQLILVAHRYNDAGIDQGEVGRAILPHNGLSQAYGWAGLGNAHYRIFLRMKKFYGYSNEEYHETQLNPQEWLILEANHNIVCVGPLGPDAPFTPLNLNK